MRLILLKKKVLKYSNIQKLCDENLYIPMQEACESLNVGVACSILLYELGE